MVSAERDGLEPIDDTVRVHHARSSNDIAALAAIERAAVQAIGGDEVTLGRWAQQVKIDDFLKREKCYLKDKLIFNSHSLALF